jgi:hypothetical protein
MGCRAIALGVSIAILVTGASFATEPRPLVLRKTFFKSGAPNTLMTITDTPLSSPFKMSCNVGVGRCYYEATVTVVMSQNSNPAVSVGIYLAIDGGYSCTTTGLIPADNSFFERTALVQRVQVARGDHTLRIGLCPNIGGATVNSYRATVNLYTH